jgi:hypothetical protein
MKIDLEGVFKTLGLPLGLIVVIGATLTFLGVPLEIVLSVAAGLVGVQLLLSLMLDVLKWAGALPDKLAGIVSAVANLLVLGAVIAALKFFPNFDIAGLDKQLLELAKVLGYLFVYITQIVGTKSIHGFATRVLGIQAFSHTLLR